MNLRQVKTKIKSYGNVKKITKAMQLVSAVKMKKAQQLAIDGKPYREELETILRKVSKKVDFDELSLLKPNRPNTNGKELIIVISSNKGLCGSFNMNLFRLMAKNMDYKNSDFVTLGSKGVQFIARVGGNVLADYSTNIPLVQVSALFDLALEQYLNGSYAGISIVYNKFISTLRSEATKEVILPIKVNQAADAEKEEARDYLIEPTPREILEQLFRSYIEEKIRGAIINSEAAEHSQRMIAMKNATDNANDLIYNLTLLGNKLRQEKITFELLDMITAKESQDSDA